MKVARPVATAIRSSSTRARIAARDFRGWLRASEASFIGLAIVVGAGAGLLSVIVGALARTLQHVLFALPPDTRLSGVGQLGLASLIVLPLGGLILAGFSYATQARKRRLVDAVEANALHGGRMSVPDSLVISGQTVLSNGFGASVGLEAAYAQMGGAAASILGGWLKLRRADQRTLVGAGAGAAIAAAFGAPLAGAFYAFEIVIGTYTPTAIAPVAGAALAGALVAQAFGVQPYLIDAASNTLVETHHYLIYGGLGAICALLGIALMRAVGLVERVSRRRWLPDWARPAVGGTLLIPVAILSPQALSAGHGALHADLAVGASIGFILLVLGAKSAASIISLGFGFRGGLFFASLFLGTLLGHLFADSLALIAGHTVIDPRNAALVGMAAFAVAVVGGPMTMAMLVLQSTHDFSLTGAVIAASLVSSSIVRELFGYSFSTWRLHLRGETIKSARDVGWVKTLTAGRMMRKETNPTPAALSIAEFRRTFPLGSTSRVVLTGADGAYAGIVVVPTAYAEGLDLAANVATLATGHATVLTPEMDITAVMAHFDAAHTDELAVVSGDRHVLGIVSESYVRRRYAEELEKAQRELFGER
ncbi:chloride channel protein [Sphingomonas sp. PB2P19]|uniref:chloride channel protein n=1 Tax=Sphingomonas rhamnosi TaxID=3096156 RepID=UPI003FA78C21